MFDDIFHCSFFLVYYYPFVVTSLLDPDGSGEIDLEGEKKYKPCDAVGGDLDIFGIY